MALDVSISTLYVYALPHNNVVLVGEDNPAFEGVFEFCAISAGGSIGM